MKYFAVHFGAIDKITRRSPRLLSAAALPSIASGVRTLRGRAGTRTKEKCMSHPTVTLPGLKAELKNLVVSVANLTHVAPGDIKDEEPLFRDGLGLDSIDLLEIAVHLEKKYGMKVQNDESGKRALSNMENLARALHAHLTGGQALA